jgi:hypothetical protein
MNDLLNIWLPSLGFALFIGAALWLSANHKKPGRVSWWAATGLAAAFVLTIYGTHALF